MMLKITCSPGGILECDKIRGDYFGSFYDFSSLIISAWNISGLQNEKPVDYSGRHSIKIKTYVNRPKYQTCS